MHEVPDVSAESTESTDEVREEKTREAPPPKLVNLADEEDVDLDSPEIRELLGLYEETLGDLSEGQIVQGKVIGVSEKDVLVDIGFKSEGVINLSEFASPQELSAGDEIEVYLERMENADGLVVLSKQRADFLRVWNKIKEAYDDQEIVEGRLVRRIKGGVVVDLFGVDAFLPGSQVALRRVPNLDDLIGQQLSFRVIKLNKRRRNIVVSRRVVLEEERAIKRGALIKELETMAGTTVLPGLVAAALEEFSRSRDKIAFCRLIEALYASHGDFGQERFAQVLWRVRGTLRDSIDRQVEYAA